MDKLNSMRPSFVVRTTALLCIFFSLVASAVASDSNQAPLFDIPRVEEIVIDGKPDDWGERGFRVQMIQDRSGEHKTPEDIDVSFRLGWDKRGLLILLRVRDDVFFENLDVSSLYERDSVELFAAPYRGSPDLYQVQIAPGMDSEDAALRYSVTDLRQNSELRKQTIFFAAERSRLDDGYVLEALLSWENLNIEPKEGVEFAFQLVVNDNDRDGRITRLQWYPGAGTVSDSKISHRIRLALLPSPPVLAAASLSYVGQDKLRVFVVADEALSGSEIAIVGATGARLAVVALESANGRARGETTLPYPLPSEAGKHLKMISDGRPVGTIDQQLMPPPAPEQALFGRNIARTMSLLAESSPEEPSRVKILFLGQILIVGDWWKTLTATLRNRYPHAELIVENLAVGPYGSALDTAEHKVYPMYPDLVILHMSSGTEPGGAMERLIREIRSRTTAEIMLCSHLLTDWKAGQGDDAKTPNHRSGDSSSAEIKALAKKYDCEFVDIRNEWRRYMDDNGLDSDQLMYGGQNNLNTKGNMIVDMLFTRHFQYQRGFSGKLAASVRTFPVAQAADGSLKIEFEGNRIDLLPSPIKEGETAGTARVLLDGKPPSEHPELYVMGVPSKPPIGYWPAIKRVAHIEELVLEDWTLRVTEVNSDNQSFDFELEGSVTGPDGAGNSQEKFVSNSGRAVIEPGAWLLIGNLGAILEKGGEIKIKWTVLPQFMDIYRASGSIEPGREAAVTIVQGLTKGKHSLELLPDEDGSFPIESVRVYNPPL